MNHSRTLLVLALAGLAVLPGCKHQENKGPSGIKIGLLLADASSPYGQAIQLGANATAKKRRFDLVVQDAKGDAAEQARELDAVLGQGVSVVVVQPIDPEALVPAAKKANEAKIYLVALDRPLPKEIDVSTVAEVDQEAAGQLLGDYLGSRLKDGGSVGVVAGTGSPGEAERLKALRAYLKEKSPSVKLASEAKARTADDAQAAAGELVKGGAKAIVALSDETALGAAAGVKNAGTKDVFVAGYGGAPPTIDELKKPDSPLAMILAPYPQRLGRFSTQTAYNIACNKAASAHAEFPVQPVTKETAAAFPGWRTDAPKEFTIPWKSDLKLEVKKD